MFILSYRICSLLWRGFFLCEGLSNNKWVVLDLVPWHQGDVKLWMERWFVRFFRHCNLESTLPGTFFSFLVGDGDILFNWEKYTPKTNMEPEKDGFQKESHGTWKGWFPKGISFSKPSFSGSMLVSGVYWKTYGSFNGHFLGIFLGAWPQFFERCESCFKLRKMEFVSP